MAAKKTALTPAKKVTQKATGQAKTSSAAKQADKKAAPTNSRAKKSAAKKLPADTAETKSAGLDSTISLVGKKAPSFQLSNQDGKLIKSSSLAKKPYVLYFYPKDNTPGCTTESCDFRDGMPNFSSLGVTVIGVSPDSTKSHAGFAHKYELPFTLLSDPDKELAQAYGVWALKKNYGREYWGIVRSTFLIGADGKVKKEWRGVKVKGHVEAVLEAAGA